MHPAETRPVHRGGIFALLGEQGQGLLNLALFQ